MEAAPGFWNFLPGTNVRLLTYETNISDGWDDPDVHQDPPEKREEAFKMVYEYKSYIALIELINY